MSQAWKADVIITVDRETPTNLHGLRRVLDLSGPALHRLIVVHDAPPGSPLDAALESLASTDPRVELCGGPELLGDVDACIRGLVRRSADAVLLSGHVDVSPGWLSELAEVAHSEERIAAASPVIDRGVSAGPGGDLDVRAACSGLPARRPRPG